MRKRTQYTPAGAAYNLYLDMLEQPHLLIAGATGSGKSVTLNAILHTALYKSPAQVQFILIDPKKVELSQYKPLPHTLIYADEKEPMLKALETVCNIIEKRYKEMQKQSLKDYSGGAIYVIIDELADLMTTDKKRVMPLIQRIGQVGRAANVHMIACTQCPLTVVIPTPIKVNFAAILGLRTATPQHSRNIINIKGCEKLPDPRAAGTAYGYYRKGASLELYELPDYTKEEHARLLEHWKPRRPFWK